MKVFIGLTEVAGYYSTLRSGFRALGIHCDFINFSIHPFQYGGEDAPIFVIHWIRRLRRAWKKTSPWNFIFKFLWGTLHELCSFFLFFWALFHYDVFIFGAISAFFCRYFELPVLKFFKKKIIFVFNGTDGRPPYISGGIDLRDNGKNLTARQYIRIAKGKKRIIRFIEKYANALVSHPPSSHFHEKPFVMILVLGIPHFIGRRHDAKPAPMENTENSPGSPIKILHSPSAPKLKGTVEIRRVIEALRKKGHNLEWIEITGSAHEVVLKELRQCDFVVDQLYSDTPMAGFATEAAFLGKPAVVGGYYARQLHRDIPLDKIPPSFYCHPDEIQQAIEKMIVDREYRLALGRKAHEFVTSRWRPEQVAERYRLLIKGGVPEEWRYDPVNIQYLQGVGLPEDRARERVRGVIQQGGRQALQLSDKPDLEERFLHFSQVGTSPGVSLNRL